MNWSLIAAREGVVATASTKGCMHSCALLFQWERSMHNWIKQLYKYMCCLPYWFGIATSLSCSILKSGGWFVVINVGIFTMYILVSNILGITFRRNTTPISAIKYCINNVAWQPFWASPTMAQFTCLNIWNAQSVVMYKLCVTILVVLSQSEQ